MRILSMLAALSLTLGLSTDASAADAKPNKPTEWRPVVPPYALNTQVFNFPTGLKILMQSDRSHPVATTWMIVNHGSADDPRGKEETAHFVEHTWFRSKHGDLPPIMDTIQDLGTMFNATTRNDWTDYRTVASSEFLPIMLRLESLRLTEPYAGVTEDEIDVEREVIRNEWRRRNEQNSALFFEYLYSSVYPDDHPYHDHSTHETMDNIKLADLQKYFDDYYTPENTTIFIVGDFDPDDAASLIFENFDPQLLHPDLTEEMLFWSPKIGIEEPDKNNPDHFQKLAWDPASWLANPEAPELFKFSESPPPRITENRPPVPDLGSAEVREEEGPFDYRTVVLGWSLPAGFRDDQWNLQILGVLASNYIASGFVDELDQKRITDLGCFAQPEILNTTFACYAELKDDDLDAIRVRDRMLDQFAEIWNPEQSVLFDFFFARSRNELLADVLLNMDVFAQQFGGRAETITPAAHYSNRPQALSDGIERINNIDGRTIAQLAYDYLRRDRAATVILHPMEEEDIDIGSESSTYRGANATDQVLKSSDDLSQYTDSQIAEQYVAPDLSDLEDFTLDNGMRVVILPHGEAPVVQASVILRRDNYAEPVGLSEFATNFTRSVGHDPLPVAGSVNWYFQPGQPGFPGYGYPLASPSWWDNAIRLEARVPSGNLDGALWILREEVDSAKPYIDRKASYIKDRRDDLKVNWATRDWHVTRVRNDFLFPGLDTSLDWEDIDAMNDWSGADVKGFIESHVRPDNATLLIVGNIDGAEAKKMAQSYFGGWKKPSAALPDFTPQTPNMPTEKSKILVFDVPERTQSQVQRFCRLNYAGPEDDIAVDVLSSLIGNKTFSTLRVKEGLAYSPGAYSGLRDNNSGFLIFTSLAVNSGVGRTLEFFTEAAEDVENGDIDEQEVILHKLRRARRDGLAGQSIAQVTGALTNVVRADKGWDFATERGELIAGVEAADLQRLLQGCAEHNITTIEGPKDVVIPQLDEKGYEYELVEYRAYGDDLLWQHDPKDAKKREKKRQKKERKDAKEAAKKKKAAEGSSYDSSGSS